METEFVIDAGDHEIETFETFDKMGLNENLLKGIYAKGFEKPSPIQMKAIIPIAKGLDIIAQSQSGTGKTATFTIGLLQRMDMAIEAPQAIILSPTRILAKQTYDVIKELSSFYTGIGISLLIGGEKTSRKNKYNFKAEKMGETKNFDKCQIIVGSPGKICQLIGEGKIPLEAMKILVLDEADEMLSLGFREDMQSIISKMSKTVQMCLISASIAEGMEEITNKFMNSPIKFYLKPEEVTLDGITQYYLPLEHEKYKIECLLEIYRRVGITQGVIFVNSKSRAEELCMIMREQSHEAECITGNMSNEDRNIIMSQFKAGKIRVLIATDIIARGIDVQQISLVMNYDLPEEKETYIHRIGRSGRYGRKGVAINFMSGVNDAKKINDIKTYYSTKMEPLPENIESIIV